MQREWFEKDYYATLGVSSTATPKEITSAYRKLARELHPDANPGDQAAEDRFKEVSAAYEVVGDPDKRAEYDEARRMGPMAGAFGAGGGGPGAGAGARFDSGDLGDLIGNLFSRGRAGGGTHATDLVVLLALLRVAHDLVGRGHLFEAVLGGLVAGVRVGVELAGQLPVGGRDLLLRGRRGHAEDGVVVLLEPLTLHVPPPICARAAGRSAGPAGTGQPRTRTMAARRVRWCQR